MPETGIPLNPAEMLEEIRALRARVHELEQERNGHLPSPDSPAVTTAQKGDAQPETGPFFPYQLVEGEASEGVAALGEQYQIQYCNHRLATMLGAAYSQLLDRPFAQIVAPQYRSRLTEFLESTQPQENIDVSLVTGDNRHLPVHLVKRRPPPRSSRSTHLVVAAMERKTRPRPRVSRQPLSELFNHSPVAMFLSRLEDGRLLEVNDRFLQLTGYRREQVIGKTSLEIGLWPSASDRAAVVESLQRGNSGHHFVGTVRTRLGKSRNVLLSVSLLVRGDEQFILGMLEDITERKEEQGVLNFQSQLLANVQDAIIGTDLNENITYWNPGAEQIYGWKAERVLGKNLHQVVRSNISPEKRAETLRLVKETGRIFIPDAHHHRRNGKLIHIESTIVAIRGNDGEVQGFAGSYRDVTERKQADVALGKSEEKFAKIFRSSPVGMGLTTRDGVELDVNESLLRLLGYKREDFVGKNVLELDFWPNLITAARIGLMVAAGQAVRDVEVQWRTRTGELKDVLLSVEPIEVNDKACLLGMAVDITERKRMEGELRRLNVDLERRVAERTAELERTNEDLVREIERRERIEEELRHAEHKANDLIRYAPTAIYEIDFRGPHFTRVNDAMCQMSGYTREELLAMDPLDLLDEEGKNQLRRRARAVLAGEAVEESVEYTVKAKDGREIFAVLQTRPIYEGKKSIGVYVIAHDVTERKRAEQVLTGALERLQAHENNSPLAVVEFDPDYRITSWSAGAERMFGWSSEEVVGRRIGDLHWVHPEDAERVARIGIEMAAGKELRNVNLNRNYRKDGSLVECEWYNSGLLDASGKLISVRSQVLNVTERKEAREQIETLNRHLEQRAVELERANRELEAFSYSVSHDLRTPLASINGFVRLIEDDYASQIPEDARRYLTMIRSGMRQMDNLITSLLDLARLSRHALKKQPVDMTALVTQALDTLQHEPVREDVTVEIQDLPAAEADPVLLKQVWVNLIANALKFTRKCGKARIEIGALKSEEGQPSLSYNLQMPTPNIVYYVRDNGIGFNMEQAGRLFGIFQRLHGEDEYEGTGVGLATVQRIIHRHGGRVWAEGEEGQGATFYFTLP